MNVRKAVIAAAGFGTRFLPQTKAMPKEMLPIVDKPIIQYVVEELIEAGIRDIVLVTGYHKRSIEDHFDTISEDLATNLRQSKKHDILTNIQEIPALANFAYVRQKGIYGNATPIMNASHLIGNEPFIYAYADDIYSGSPSRFQQTVAQYKELGTSVIPCLPLSKDEEYDRYGIVGGDKVKEGLIRMTTIKEKPGHAKAPSNLASVAGYLFTPDIFPYLERMVEQVKPGQEFRVQDVIQCMMDEGHPFHAFELKDSRYYDTGNKLEYLKTVCDFALQREDIKDELRDYLRSLKI